MWTHLADLAFVDVKAGSCADPTGTTYTNYTINKYSTKDSPQTQNVQHVFTVTFGVCGSLHCLCRLLSISSSNSVSVLLLISLAHPFN